MEHVRQQIRAAAKSLLTDLPLTGRNVFASRARRPNPEETPALFLYTRNEEAERVCVNPVAYRRTLELFVELVSIDPLADDVVDNCCADIEAKLAGTTFGGLAKFCTLRSTLTDYTDDPDYPGAAARVEFSVEYMTTGADPSAPF